MRWNRYRFRSVWRIDAPPADVYAVLERADEYPSWWPQVREVRRSAGAEGETGSVRFRSVLPYDLLVTARPGRQDPAGGLLEILMAGDLEGWVRWTVRPRPDGDGSVVLFAQEVEVRKPLLRALAVPGRPLLVLNHAVMMRGGQRGLRRRLRTGFGAG